MISFAITKGEVNVENIIDGNLDTEFLISSNIPPANSPAKAFPSLNGIVNNDKIADGSCFKTESILSLASEAKSDITFAKPMNGNEIVLNIIDGS